MGNPVRAVLFDLDGTLVNTEVHTDQAIRAVAARHGVDGFGLPADETHGRTWMHIAGTMRARTDIEASADALAQELLDDWSRAARQAQPVPGAAEAIRAAATAGLKLAIVSSSPRPVIDRFIESLEVGECIGLEARVGAESVSRGKPDPEGFLLAARALGVDAAAALVFEDSRAGLLAAQAAGMRSVFVTCCAAEVAANSALATACCADYEHLPARFWPDLRAGVLDLNRRVFA